MSNAVDKQISSILSLIKEQAKNAEDTYDKKADRLLNQAERSINLYGGGAVDSVADIVTQSEMICDELYAAYQSLVKVADDECRPLLDSSLDYSTVREVWKTIAWLNSESQIENNFSASFNSNALGDIASRRYMPSIESKMIEKFWETKVFMWPDREEAEKKIKAKEAEEKRIEKERREKEAAEKKKLEIAKKREANYKEAIKLTSKSNKQDLKKALKYFEEYYDGSKAYEIDWCKKKIELIEKRDALKNQSKKEDVSYKLKNSAEKKKLDVELQENIARSEEVSESMKASYPTGIEIFTSVVGTAGGAVWLFIAESIWGILFGIFLLLGACFYILVSIIGLSNVRKLKKELKDTNNTISILEQKIQAVENEIREGIDTIKSEQINAELEQVKMTISTDYKNLEEKATLAK